VAATCVDDQTTPPLSPRSLVFQIPFDCKLSENTGQLRQAFSDVVECAVPKQGTAAQDMFAVHAVSLCAFVLASNSFIQLSNICSGGVDCTVIMLF